MIFRADLCFLFTLALSNFTYTKLFIIFECIKYDMATKKQIEEIKSRKKPTKGFSEADFQFSAERTIPTIRRNQLMAKLNIKDFYGSYGWKSVSSSMDLNILSGNVPGEISKQK